MLQCRTVIWSSQGTKHGLNFGIPEGEKVIGTPALRSSAAAGHAWQSDTLPAALVLSAVRAGSQITDGAPAGSRSGSRHSSG
jgi:hypothetical protein